MAVPPTAPASSGLKVPVPTSAPLAFETSLAPIAKAAIAPIATSTVPIRAPSCRRSRPSVRRKPSTIAAIGAAAQTMTSRPIAPQRTPMPVASVTPTTEKTRI